MWWSFSLSRVVMSYILAPGGSYSLAPGCCRIIWYIDKTYWDKKYRPKTYHWQNLSATKCVGNKTYWQQNILATKHIGNKTYWQQNILATKHIGYKTYWLQNILATKHIGYKTYRRQKLLETKRIARQNLALCLTVLQINYLQEWKKIRIVLI